MRKLLGWTGAILNFIGYGGQIIVFGYVNWTLFRHNLWSLLNPFLQIDVLWRMLFLPWFWIMLALALGGWGLMQWSEKIPESSGPALHRSYWWLLVVSAIVLGAAVFLAGHQLSRLNSGAPGSPQPGPGGVTTRGPSGISGESSTGIANMSDVELGVLYRLTGRAFLQEFTAADVDSYRWVGASYERRTGKQLSSENDRHYVTQMRLVFEYDEELQKCLLGAFDSRRPEFSLGLRGLMKRVVEEGAVPGTKVSADSALVHAVASRAPWSTQYGEAMQPLSRDAIIAGLAVISRLGRNVSFFDSALGVTPAR